MEYKFGKAADACSRCNHSFQEGETFISALRDAALAETADPATASEPSDGEEDARFSRLDLCNDCWPEEPRTALFSWWLSSKAVRPPKPPTADPEFLWLLLGHTLSHHEPDLEESARNPLAVQLGYLAALGLLRLKHVQLGRHRRLGGRAFQSFVPRESRQREIVVLDPEPSDEALQAVEQILHTLAEEVREGSSFEDLLRRHADALPAALAKPSSKKKRRAKKKSRPRNVTRI